MKKILYALLVLCMLCCTGCAAQAPAEHTVEHFSDGSYMVTSLDNAAGQDRTYYLASVNEDGQPVTVTVTLSPELAEQFSQRYESRPEITYPKLVQRTDGQWERVIVDQYGNPLNSSGEINLTLFFADMNITPVITGIENQPAYPALMQASDGSYRVVMKNEDGQLITRTKTATKVSRFYSADGTLQWTMAVTATFTYDGLQVSCGDVSSVVTIADTDNWYLISENTVGSSYTVRLGRTTLGVTTSAPSFTLELRCSESGALS